MDGYFISVSEALVSRVLPCFLPVWQTGSVVCECKKVWEYD